MSEQKSNTHVFALVFYASLLALACFLLSMSLKYVNKYDEVEPPTQPLVTMEEAYKLCLDRNGTFEMNGETLGYTCSIDRQQLFENQRG